MVLASKSQDDVLAPWRRAAAMRMTFVVGLVLLIAVIGYYLVNCCSGSAWRAPWSPMKLISACWPSNPAIW